MVSSHIPKRIFPLYHGPLVSIRIGSSSQDEFRVSRDLLCRQSPYFAATFWGNFKEGIDQSTTLEEEDGVVTTQSFQMLLQWLYTGTIGMGELSSSEAITAIMEFVRLADMCDISGVESPMAGLITSLILSDDFELSDASPWCLEVQHVASAAALPKGHLVRKTLAEAAVKGYLYFQDSRFVDVAEEFPDFSVDVLVAMKDAFKSFTLRKNRVSCKDPVSGDIFNLTLRTDRS